MTSHQMLNTGTIAMSNDPVLDQVAKTASEALRVDVTEITPETHIDALGMTSLDFVTIAMDLEDFYGLEMFTDNEQQFSTISEIVQHVRQTLDTAGRTA